ncbi:hypothetical protein [Streptomyces sp. NPDC007110]|uniref:hypothetical protein n=1 Tax=Streptomyces sp. NPDC007110 TaxID=3156916 RepID=UPI0033EF0D68
MLIVYVSSDAAAARAALYAAAMNGIDWGDVPTWLGAVFAAGAAAAAVWTLASQRVQIREQRQFIAEQAQNLSLERAELRAAAEDRRWSQARQVLMQGLQLSHGSGGQFWKVQVVNRSDAPIRDLHVRFGDAYLPSETHEVRTAASNLLRSVIGETWSHPLHSLGAGRAVIFDSQAFQPHTAHNSRPSLKFTDDNGIRWKLDHHGVLTESSDDPQS